MSKRNVSGLLLTALVLTGCATTSPRNNQADIDSLNARVTALQGQLAEKDQQITSMQGQMGDMRMSREAAEAEKQRLADQLEAAKAASSKAKAPASDLK